MSDHFKNFDELFRDERDSSRPQRPAQQRPAAAQPARRRPAQQRPVQPEGQRPAHPARPDAQQRAAAHPHAVQPEGQQRPVRPRPAQPHAQTRPEQSRDLHAEQPQRPVRPRPEGQQTHRLFFPGHGGCSVTCIELFSDQRGKKGSGFGIYPQRKAANEKS